MTNEEKIRLVLETLGTDNVKQANRVLREMQEELTKVGEASSKAAGKGGVNGAGVLQLAYFIDDLQYGMRGIMNNIPTLIQSLGLGAGLAGVAGIAAVAISQLVEKFPEWTAGNEKVKLTLIELMDAIKAEEESVKRQKEQVDKLSKSNSDRIQDLIKLKVATEDLKAAEEQLAEDRKNRKAFDDAEKNVAVAQKEELEKRKGAFRDLVTDAGGEKDLRDQISNAVADAMPGVEITESDRQKAMSQVASEAGSNLKNMSPGEIRRRTEAKLKKLREDRIANRDAEISKSTEGIFGGLANPANVEEYDAALEQLGKFVPGQAASIRGLIEFDNQNAQFDAGNERWRQFGGARRRARERDFAAGERTGAAMLPNRGTMEEAQNAALAKDNFAREAADKARRDIMTGLADVLPDPVTLAAMRRGNAGIGVGAVGRMRALEATDQQALFGTFRNAGMNEGDAKRSVAEYMQQGNEAFAEFAQANGMNAKNLSSGFKASQALIQKIMQDQAEVQEVIRWMESMMNMQNQPQAKPPNRVRN